jgi:CDP-glucose 4,6-dehydratase
MRALVTGGTGFFGAWMAKYLLSTGYEVISVMHDTKNVSTDSLLGIRDKITWAHGSVLDPEFVKRVIAEYEVDEVYHFAALPIVRVAVRTTVPIFTTNVIGTINVLEAVKEQQLSGFTIRMAYCSTDKVYGPMVSKNPYREGMALQPVHAYECSKAMADLAAQGYSKSWSLDAVVVRPSNVYGPGDLNSRIIPNTIRHCIKGEHPVLYKGMTYVREFTYVEDACGGIYAALHSPDKERGEVFNLGSSVLLNQEQVISKIMAFFPRVTATYQQPPPYSAKEIEYQALDSSKIRAATGWKPNVSFDEGLRRTVEWWKSNKDKIEGNSLVVADVPAP